MSRKTADCVVYALSTLVLAAFCLCNPLINHTLREATLYFTPEKKAAGIILVLKGCAVQLIAVCIALYARRKAVPFSLRFRVFIGLLLASDLSFSLFQLLFWWCLQDEVALGRLIIINLIVHILMSSVLLVLSFWQKRRQSPPSEV